MCCNTASTRLELVVSREVVLVLKVLCDSPSIAKLVYPDNGQRSPPVGWGEQTREVHAPNVSSKRETII